MEEKGAFSGVHFVFFVLSLRLKRGLRFVLRIIDTLGNIVIAPQYQFARPFKDGKAQVTNSGKMMKDSSNVDAHEYWQSDNWQVITRPK